MTEGLARLGQDPYGRRRGVSRRTRLRRTRTVLVALLLIAVIVVIASQGGTKPHTASGDSVDRGTAGHAHGHTSPPAPPYALTMTAKKTLPAVNGSVPSIPWPSTGQAAVAVPSAGLLETSGTETSVPIASLTKMMTAYLTLEQHPLTATSVGPSLTMTAADQQEYDLDQTTDASSVLVEAGEVLTERQLLQGMIVRSANNIADLLGGWDGGSITAFVQRMNAEAAELGMTSTHYVDTNGLDAGSVSTARDQLILAETALQLPSFASIVDQPTVTLPYVGTLSNYVSAVGSDGVVGVKSGFTDAASSCVVLAAMRQVGNQQVMILAADLGQPLSLDYAQQEDLQMINAVASGLQTVTVAPAHDVVGKLSLKVNGKKKTALVETATPLVAIAWPGSNVSVYTTEDHLKGSVHAGNAVGYLDASSAGGEPAAVPLVAVSPIKT